MEEQELKNEITTYDQQINAIMVTKDTYEQAGQMIIGLDKLLKKINEYWKELVDKAYAAHKALTAKRAEMYNPVKDRRDSLNRKISAYLTAQEEIRREEQRRLDEARRKAEDAEKKKLEARAVKAEDKGNTEKADELRQKAEDVYIPPAVVVPEVEKTTRMEAGTVSAKKDIDIEITDEMAILKAIIAGTLPISIITISESKLKQAIKLHQIERLDGVIIRNAVKAQFRASA